MNISTSEHSSSGCESGWTTYLDQLSNSNSRGFYTNYEENGRFSYANHHSKQEQEADDDEDLSMVSDASSGPPYYAYNSSFSQEKNKSKTKEEIWPKKQSLCLDDTASSPAFNFSKKNVPPKHDHDEGESISKKHLSFFKSSKKGKSGSLLGRKRQ